MVKKEFEEKTRREILDMEGVLVSQDNVQAFESASKSDLNKYKALPPIGETAASRDTINTSASTECIYLLLILALQEQIAQVILPPPSYDLILTIKARTYDSKDFRDGFNGYDTFHFEKQTIRNIPMDDYQDDLVSFGLN